VNTKEQLVGWAQDDAATIFKLKLSEQINSKRRLFEAQFNPANEEFSPLLLGLQQGRIQGMKNMLEMLENLAND
jgi:hypothetical protein